MSFFSQVKHKLKLAAISTPFYEFVSRNQHGINLNDYIPGLHLSSDSLVVDCGANIGDFTSVVARTGAFVISVEPHGGCFSILKKRFSLRKNVELKNCAVSNHDGKTKLYHHKTLPGIEGSQASSLEVEKSNLDPNQYEEVDTVRLSDLIKSQNREVDLVKIDIEGHEDVVLNDLIDSGAIEKIKYVLVERHDGKYEFLKERLAQVEQKIANKNLQRKINLNWR